MTISFNWETIGELRRDIGPLAREHWLEVAHHKDKVALDPRWEEYERIERNKGLIVITARRDGELVGYAIWLFQEHLHYRGHTVAMNDVIYLAPSFRGVSGLRFVRHNDYVLRVLGADRILWHIKPDHNWSKILTRMGYKQEELIFGTYTGS